MDPIWIIVTSALAAIAAIIIVVAVVRKLVRNKRKADASSYRVTLPLPKPAANATDDGMDPTQIEGIDYRHKTTSKSLEEPSLSVNEEKLVDSMKKDGDDSTSSVQRGSVPQQDGYSISCEDRSDRPGAIPPDSSIKKDTSLIMFEAPPPYEEAESAKTPEGKTRMIRISMPELDKTQPTNTSVAGTPSRTSRLSTAPHFTHPPLIPGAQSPHIFSGPLRETAVNVPSVSTEKENTATIAPHVACKSPNMNTTSMAGRSEIELGVNGQDAGHTPQVLSPVQSATGIAETNSTLVTFTPSGTSTREAK